jgi:hypothetical protein
MGVKIAKSIYYGLHPMFADFSDPWMRDLGVDPHFAIPEVANRQVEPRLTCWSMLSSSNGRDTRMRLMTDVNLSWRWDP